MDNKVPAPSFFSIYSSLVSAPLLNTQGNILRAKSTDPDQEKTMEESFTTSLMNQFVSNQKHIIEKLQERLLAEVDKGERFDTEIVTDISRAIMMNIEILGDADEVYPQP
jgi:hypothetical protein